METIVKKLYEAMFLVDSAQAASDWDGVNKAIETILKKADAEIVSMKKWDDRRLAYEIRGKAKGTYILCYFKVAGERIKDIERDVQLSERIMRVLILCAEGREQEATDIKTPTELVEKQEEKPAQAVEPPQQEQPVVEEEAKAPEVMVADTTETEEPKEPKEPKETGEPEEADAQDEQQAGDIEEKV